MMNPIESKKKGFRAFAERDNGRKLAEETVAPEKATPEQPPKTEAVKARPAPGK